MGATSVTDGCKAGMQLLPALAGPARLTKLCIHHIRLLLQPSLLLQPIGLSCLTLQMPLAFWHFRIPAWNLKDSYIVFVAVLITDGGQPSPVR